MALLALPATDKRGLTVCLTCDGEGRFKGTTKRCWFCRGVGLHDFILPFVAVQAPKRHWRLWDTRIDAPVFDDADLAPDELPSETDIRQIAEHANAEARKLAAGKWQHPIVKYRRQLVALSRSDASCAICHGTGVYHRDWRSQMVRELRGCAGCIGAHRHGQRIAASTLLVDDMPCFNPQCTAVRPANSCADCHGYGQVVRGGELTDIACGTCRGFGTSATPIALEAAA